MAISRGFLLPSPLLFCSPGKKVGLFTRQQSSSFVWRQRRLPPPFCSPSSSGGITGPHKFPFTHFFFPPAPFPFCPTTIPSPPFPQSKRHPKDPGKEGKRPHNSGIGISRSLFLLLLLRLFCVTLPQRSGTHMRTAKGVNYPVLLRGRG